MDYSKYKIATNLRYWEIFLYSKTQNDTPLRMYAVYNEELEGPLTEAPIVAQLEFLFLVRPVIELVIQKYYGDNVRVNVEELRNQWPQLHIHFVPRHDTPITLFGHTETDPNPTGRLVAPKEDTWSEEEKQKLILQLQIDFTFAIFTTSKEPQNWEEVLEAVT